MEYRYKTSGTCSREIAFEIEDNKISSIQFFGGCNGNLKGICALVTGMEVDEVINKLDGIHCGFKSTSSPDQLARALKQVKNG